MLVNNWIAFALTFLISVVWLRLNDFAAHRNWVSSYLSRKIIHIGTGPIFVLCWLFFQDTPSAPYLAAIIPLIITVQFILVGFGVIRDEAAVKAMSRSGNPREILRGPMLYGLIFTALTIIYWKDSPIGIIALMILCGGDGLADLIGRRWERNKLRWNKEKSWMGSLAMFVGGWSFSLFVLAVYNWIGVFPYALNTLLLPTALITLGTTLVESLPIHDLDNLTITITGLALGHLLL